MTKLLSIQADAKTTKGDNYGFMTAILYLEPDEILCAHASKGCMEGCLKSSGRMGMTAAMTARERRTALWYKSKDAFLTVLELEIEAFVKKAERKGIKPVVRLNGTSDIVWEAVRFAGKGQNIFEKFPQVQFYDYTKNERKIRRNRLPNYSLTFSLSEDNWATAEKLAAEGHNVAVVFRKDLPKTFWGREVVDGDKHDLRFLDPKGVVIGLKAKGKARKDVSGFVRDADEAAANAA
jgi:hypothetical protein